jgi:hypothetical protein
MSEASRWWRPRFRLASLLWLMLCIALAIGMYRCGYQTGHDDALNQRTFMGTTNVRVYEVASIVPMNPGINGAVIADFDSLMSDLKKEVLPYTWDDRGGGATMAEFPTNMSLVISHDEDGHERIGKWLRQRRDQTAKLQPSKAASAVAKKSASR